MKSNTALDLLIELFTDIRQIQIQLIHWLPNLIPRVHHAGLRHLVAKHASDSSEHLIMLDQFFQRHEAIPVDGLSKAIGLIINEPHAGGSDFRDPDRSDLRLLIQFLRIEQFEITSYEIVAKVADQLGYSEDADMLVEFIGERDSSAEILRELQGEMLKNAVPIETKPDPFFGG